MANDTTITIAGNLTADPDCRYTPNGVPVANFTVASTPSKFDKQKNEFVDDETIFMRCNVWREQAENVAESIQKGTRVIVVGKLKSRSFEDKEGNKRTVMELEAEEVAPSLKRATAAVTKNAPKGGGFGGHPADREQSGGQQSGGFQSGQQQSQQGGGWGQNPQQGQQDAWAGQGQQGGNDEPPF